MRSILFFIGTVFSILLLLAFIVFSAALSIVVKLRKPQADLYVSVEYVNQPAQNVMLGMLNHESNGVRFKDYLVYAAIENSACPYVFEDWNVTQKCISSTLDQFVSKVSEISDLYHACAFSFDTKPRFIRCSGEDVLENRPWKSRASVNVIEDKWFVIYLGW